MNAPDSLINENYQEYVRLLRALHALFVEGKEDSPEAEELRDRMDAAWETLSQEQEQSIRGLAADLNSIRRGPVPSGENREEVFQRSFPALIKAKESGHWHEVLTHLRPLAPFLPPSGLAYVRGRAWRELGEYGTALLFFEHAKKLEPDNGKYAYLALDCLAQVDLERAACRVNEILENGVNHPGAEIIEAASIQWAAKNELPMGLTDLILEDLAEVF